MQKTPSELDVALAALEPQSKVARLRASMPAIEARLDAGVRAADILQVLAQAGLELTPATFKSYLQRHRRKLRASGAVPTTAPAIISRSGPEESIASC